MRSFATILASAAAILLSAGTAMADGMSIKDSPAPVAEARTCDGGPFAGFYIGAAVGYGGQDTTGTNVYQPSPAFGESADFDDNGFAASAYSGYNIQCGRLVVGYESDYNWMDLDNRVGDCCNYLDSDMKWFGTSRLRIGIAHDERVLFYATGGIAYARIDSTAGVDGVGSWSDDDWHFGWTAGGGVEFLRHDNWMIRAEALYVDVGDKTYNYSQPLGCVGSCAGSVNWENEFWVARLGLTYRFGAREEVAAPLK